MEKPQRTEAIQYLEEAGTVETVTIKGGKFYRLIE
jgi:hypothetical protein